MTRSVESSSGTAIRYNTTNTEHIHRRQDRRANKVGGERFNESRNWKAYLKRSCVERMKVRLGTLALEQPSPSAARIKYHSSLYGEFESA